MCLRGEETGAGCPSPPTPRPSLNSAGLFTVVFLHCIVNSTFVSPLLINLFMCSSTPACNYSTFVPESGEYISLADVTVNHQHQHYEGVIDTRIAQPTMNDMAQPLRYAFGNALRKQAQELANRIQDGGDTVHSKEIEVPHIAEVEKLKVEMQSIRDTSKRTIEALRRQHKADISDMGE